MMLDFLASHIKIVYIVVWMIPTLTMFFFFIKRDLRLFDSFWMKIPLIFTMLMVSIAWPFSTIIIFFENIDWPNVWYHIIYRDKIKREKHADKYL